MDSREWSKQYSIFSVSRLDLRHQLGFTHDQISKLSDTDMQLLVERVRETYSYLEVEVWETVREKTARMLAEKAQKNHETFHRGA